MEQLVMPAGLDPGPSDPGLATDPSFVALSAGSHEHLVGRSLIPADLQLNEAAAHHAWRDA